MQWGADCVARNGVRRCLSADEGVLIVLAGIYDGLEAKDISVRACSHKRKENA